MNRFKVLFYLLAGVVSFVLLLYGFNIFPTPGTDSKVFIPPALLYSRGMGLVNPLYDLSLVLGPGFNFKFNYYVPFYPLLLGTLSKVHPGIRTIFLICSLFSVTGLFLYCHRVITLLPQQL